MSGLTQTALPEWAYICEPENTALLKSSNSDFIVKEQLGFEPEGEGEHVYLYVRKDGVTTEAVIKDLAKALGLARKQISYSGLKDKYAVTEQWLCYPWPIKQDLPDVSGESWRVLRQCRHPRKLKRGVHPTNAFSITLRNIDNQGDLESKLQKVSERGFPNYFGEQRFGFDGGNIEKAFDFLLKGGRLPPFKKSLYLSVVRSYCFNQEISRRLESGDVFRARIGEAYNLDGTNSFFKAEEDESEIQRRLDMGDIHPVGVLPGEDRFDAALLPAGYDAELIMAGLRKNRVKSAYRPLRERPKSLHWEFVENQACRLDFELRSGSFATSMMRELVKYQYGQ